jgi:hypothetical protein
MDSDGVCALSLQLDGPRSITPQLLNSLTFAFFFFFAFIAFSEKKREKKNVSLDESFLLLFAMSSNG